MQSSDVVLKRSLWIVIPPANMQDAAHLCGIEEIILDSEIVAFPSFFESFGLVALEAMIASKKVILSSRGALPEISAKYPNVFYLKEITPNDIADKIRIGFKTPYSNAEWDNPYTQIEMGNHLSKIFEGY